MKNEMNPLRVARLAAGLKQKELAELSGVNVRQIQRIESGASDIKNMTAGNMLALCSVLGVALEELMGECTEHPGRILCAKEIFSKATYYEELTQGERMAILKVEQAKEYSGWRRYPSTCSSIFRRIPDEWWDKYSSSHIGEVAALLKSAYDDGRQNPSPDEYQKVLDAEA